MFMVWSHALEFLRSPKQVIRSIFVELVCTEIATAAAKAVYAVNSCSQKIN